MPGKLAGDKELREALAAKWRCPASSSLPTGIDRPRNPEKAEELLKLGNKLIGDLNSLDKRRQGKSEQAKFLRLLAIPASAGQTLQVFEAADASR